MTFRCRGRVYEDEGDAQDTRHDESVVAYLDDWSEAIAEDQQRAADKRAAAQMSPELLFTKETA